MLGNKMKNINKRVLTAFAMVAVVASISYFGLLRILATLVALGMIAEVIKCKIQAKKKWSVAATAAFFIYSTVFVASAYFVGAKPWIMLLMFVIIAAADTSAWFFGTKFGRDKLWERLSPNKTWTGQIAGIICGTTAAVLYGLLGADTFVPSLMWIGIGVSLLSQYGDLAASAIKRGLKVKDFSHILPGHGGLADRFDGWIFVLPIVWLALVI